MRLVALDPGITTGFAIIEYSDPSLPRLVSYGEIPVLGQGIDALLDSTWIWLHTHALDADELAIEGPLSVYSVRTLVELHEVRGVIREWANWSGVPYAAYHPATIKAAVTGKASAKKALVAKPMKLLFNVERFSSDHASDATAIAVTHLIKKHEAKLGYRYLQSTKATPARRGSERGSGRAPRRRAS